MTRGVSWRGITAGQSTFPSSLNAMSKHPLTCGDAPRKMFSYPPTADSAVSREFFLWAPRNPAGGPR